ncbi:MAG: 4,5-DOPA dioxygenase extradiol [Bacteroidetes bacterium]|nr:4,5-DOPA dioxygenase extradiol [Bacteroidota bacterium]
MNRKEFLLSLATSTIWGMNMKTKSLNQLTASLDSTDTMPVLFLGHGSPMNAIEENEFVAGFRRTADGIPKPQAILCVSAHWETRGTYVTAMEHPQTIHDFGGFPRELYQVQYPAPGSQELATTTKELIKRTEVGLDHQWGLDHGAWSVIKHLYPKADVPVIQMSLDRGRDARYHYEMASELSSLRNKGVLIIGSGNMVHNLRLLAWDKLNTDGFAYDWALEAGSKMKQFIINGDHDALIRYDQQGTAFRQAVPTPEHYLPLLYVLALKGKNDMLSLFNDKAVAGSLTMTSVKVG